MQTNDFEIFHPSDGLTRAVTPTLLLEDTSHTPIAEASAISYGPGYQMLHEFRDGFGTPF